MPIHEKMKTLLTANHFNESNSNEWSKIWTSFSSQ